MQGPFYRPLDRSREWPGFSNEHGVLIGISDVLESVLEQFPSDGFNPAPGDVMVSKHPDRETLQARGKVVLDLLIQRGQHMDEAQKRRLKDGVMRDMVVVVMNIVSDWRKRAQAAHQACQELLGEIKDKPKKQKAETPDDDKLCVACLDELRSVVYRPCGHRVCCDQCATELWARSNACPWCREAVETP